MLEEIAEKVGSSVNRDKLYSSVLGYYDFIGRPQVMNPFRLRNTHSLITEIHEHIHHQLAISTSTGIAVQLIAKFAFQADSESRQRAHEAVAEIIERCRLPHEAAATYVSLLAAETLYDISAGTHKSQLPLYYTNALLLLENVFRGVPVENSLDLAVIQVVALTVTKFALSVSFEEGDFCPPEFTSLTDIVKREAPDCRFREVTAQLCLRQLTPQLMQVAEAAFKTVLGPDWRSRATAESSMDLFPGMLRASQDLAKLLSNTFPKVSAILVVEHLEKQAKAMAARVNVYLGSHAEAGNPGIEKREAQEGFAEVSIHGDPRLPKDSSIDWPYGEGSVDDLREAINTATQEELLFVHAATADRALWSLFCLRFYPKLNTFLPTDIDRRSPQFAEILVKSLPFRVSVEFGELQTLLVGAGASLCLKVDERCATDGLRSLIESSSFLPHTFLLLHDTSLDALCWHVCQKRDQTGKAMIIHSALRHGAEGLTIHALVVANPVDRVKIAVPVSELSIMRFAKRMKSEPGVSFIDGESLESLYREQEWSAGTLAGFINTTYGM